MASDSSDHWRRLENMYHSAPVNRYFEPTLEIAEGTTRLRIPVKPSSFHSAGSLHGSVYFKALDDAAFFAALSLEPEVFVVTTSFTTYLLAQVTEGELEASGRVQSRTGRMFVAESVVHCDGRVVARGNGLFSRTQIRLDSIATYAEAP